MQLEQIRLFFDHSPVMRLLQSENAPFLLDFLNATFKKHSIISLRHDDLRLQLLIYLEELHETQPEVLRGDVNRYLIAWSDSGWLNRHFQASVTEVQYQLTRHAEDALIFVDQMISRSTGLVGTESRLRLIIDTLSDIVDGASSDPDQRLAKLEQEKAAIQRQIDEIKSGRPIAVYNSAKIRDRFNVAVGLLKTLQSDFRAVEDRFHAIAMGVQQEQQVGEASRGQILGNALDAEELLKQEDEGVSFYAFIAFLFAPDQQQQLRATIDNVIRLNAVQNERESITHLRSMVKSLLQEADKVLATNGRLTSSLNKLLNVETAEDRLQTAEVLRDIKQLAIALRSESPQKKWWLTLPTTKGVGSPFARSFWTAPQSFETQPEQHVVDLERARREGSVLADMELLDLGRLRRNIHNFIEEYPTGSMTSLLEMHPPESGVMELIGYYQVVFEDGHSINSDIQEEVVLVDSNTQQQTLVRIPQVLFHANIDQDHSYRRKSK